MYELDSKVYNQSNSSTTSGKSYLQLNCKSTAAAPESASAAESARVEHVHRGQGQVNNDRYNWHIKDANLQSVSS